MKISEIANMAGVSIGTVDRVIHNRGRVSKKTKEKIEKIIQDSNYKPNPMASNLKKGKSLRIGILIPNLKSEGGYWQKIYNGILSAFDELSAFSVEKELMEFNRYIHGDLLEKGKLLFEKNIDVLALAPVVQSEAYQLIAHIKNFPYAFFDSSLKNANPITENLQDPYKAGWFSGRIMELFSPGQNKFVCLQMHETAYNLQRRAQGFSDYFKDKQATIINLTWSDTSEDLFFSFMDSVLNENQNISGFFITNDATGRLAKYLNKKNLNPFPYLIGFDLLDENREELLNNHISALISQQPEIQGYNTIQEIFRIIVLNQADTVPTNPIPINVIFKENLPD